MDQFLYPSVSTSLQETLVHQSKSGHSYRVAGTMASQISMFRLTTTAGSVLEHPIRPGERFSGVLTLDVPRPMQATQVVVEFTATERRLSGAPKSAMTRLVKTTLFASSLVVWKAQQKGVTASTVLSDGVHVYNFSCQMPYVNYPQNVKCGEYDISYFLEGKVHAPKDNGGSQVVAVVEKEMFYTPLVAFRPPSGGLASTVVETLCFEKKGKKGKPAVELRVALSSLQVVPGAKLKLDVSVKELTSSSWTKVVARLFERTVCREEGDAGAAAPPVWSVDRELANADLVRSSVYNFFLTDELIGTNATETKNADGETVTSEQLVFAVPRIPCSPLSSEHLDFSHFLRLEVYVPGWLSSDRSVYMDVPVQLMTCELSAATLLVNHNASIASIERGRHVESDEASIMSGKSGGSSSNHNNARPQSTRSTIERSIIMTAQSQPMTVGSLPPRYCDVHPTQRPAPTLVLLKHANASHDSAHDVVDQPLPQRLSRQSQSTTRHTTLSSVQSMEYKSLISGLSIADDMGEEKYRSRPLPTAPGSGPNGQGLVPPPLPPLPMAPMPDSMVPGVALFQSYPQASNSSPVSELPTPDTLNHGLIGGTPFATMTSDTSSPGSFSRKQRQSSAGSTGASATSSGAAHVRTPISPMHNDSMAVDGATSDDDAGYFKSSIARKSLEREKVFEKGMFRLRKNSSIKHTR